MGRDAKQAEQRARPARSRHAGKRRWVTYLGYVLAAGGLACLAVHLLAGWKLVRIDAMLPTYLWIVTVALLVVGALLVVANEGTRSLAGSVPVILGQVESERPQDERSEKGAG